MIGMLIDLTIDLFFYGSMILIGLGLLTVLWVFIVILRLLFGPVISGVWGVCTDTAYWIIHHSQKDEH